jgi:hypothetical protein
MYILVSISNRQSNCSRSRLEQRGSRTPVPDTEPLPVGREQAGTVLNGQTDLHPESVLRLDGGSLG